MKPCRRNLDRALKSHLLQAIRTSHNANIEVCRYTALVQQADEKLVSYRVGIHHVGSARHARDVEIHGLYLRERPHGDSRTDKKQHEIEDGAVPQPACGFSREALL